MEHPPYFPENSVYMSMHNDLLLVVFH